MKKKILIFSIVIFQSTVFAANYPFPQAVNYSYGIKPTNYTQSQMNTDCQTVYNSWRNSYLSQTGTPQSGMWRVVAEGQNGDDGNYYQNVTVSEGQGYGMLVTVMMDNSTNNTQQIYNGLFKYYRYYADNYGLMKWIIDSTGTPRSTNAATDGDIDAAMSLILADKQWGSTGEINYLQEAQNLLNNILNYEVEPVTNILRPGDVWGGTATTRPSDYVPGFFKVFSSVSGNNRWNSVINSCYNTLQYFYDNYTTGLVADFCRANGQAVVGDPGKAIENTLSRNPETDYIYGYNACRVPWRIGIDYVWYGTTNNQLAYNLLNKTSTWLKTKTNNVTTGIKNGYLLDGTEVGGWLSSTYAAPFAVAAMCSTEHQNWLNNIYDWLRTRTKTTYYEDSIKLLSMLVITGNFPNLYTITPGIYFVNLSDLQIIQGNYEIQVNANAGEGKQVSKVEFYMDNNLVGSDTDTPYSWVINTTQYDDGNHLIKVIGYNNFNQLIGTREVTVRINNAPTQDPYPDKNPFKPAQQNKCMFRNVPSGEKLKIYTVSGELVATLDETGNKIEWDGTADGKKLKSGIYFYVVGSKRGKIAIVR